MTRMVKVKEASFNDAVLPSFEDSIDISSPSPVTIDTPGLALAVPVDHDLVLTIALPPDDVNDWLPGEDEAEQLTWDPRDIQDGDDLEAGLVAFVSGHTATHVDPDTGPLNDDSDASFNLAAIEAGIELARVLHEEPEKKAAMGVKVLL
ncbi:hypothetical protein C0991_004993 [Blastosporella zonata]|nr:hypothetical protein C0991_004993 [Blastosporella zonata]